MGLFKRGNQETIIHSLVFDPSERLLFMNTAQESIHVFDVANTFSKFTGNVTWKTKALTQLSKLWTGELRSRFIFTKPSQTDVTIIFQGEDLLFISKSGDYGIRSNYFKALEEMAENSEERTSIDLACHLSIQDAMLAITPSN